MSRAAKLSADAEALRARAATMRKFRYLASAEALEQRAERIEAAAASLARIERSLAECAAARDRRQGSDRAFS
jgi:hypothetical protein